MNTSKLQHWETIKSQEVFVAPPWIKVSELQVRLPGGTVVDDYHRIELGNSVIIFAQTADRQVILERQYKHGIGKVSLVLPAGGIEPGETPVEAAKRELLEETGYCAESWRSLGTFGANGNYGCGEAHIMMAQGAHQVAEPNSGDLEQIEVILMKPDELVDRLKNGDVHLLSTAAAVALALNPVFGPAAIHPVEDNTPPQECDSN